MHCCAGRIHNEKNRAIGRGRLHHGDQTCTAAKIWPLFTWKVILPLENWDRFYNWQCDCNRFSNRGLRRVCALITCLLTQTKTNDATVVDSFLSFPIVNVKILDAESYEHLTNYLYTCACQGQLQGSLEMVVRHESTKTCSGLCRRSQTGPVTACW